MWAPLLHRHEFINTTSVDQMLALYAEVCTRIRLEPDPRSRFGCRTGYAALGPVCLFADQFDGGFRVWTDDGRDDELMLTLPIRGGQGTVMIDHEEHSLSARQRGVIGTSSRPHAFRLGPGYEALQVAFSRSELQATLAALAGFESEPYLEFDSSVDFSQGAGAALRRTIEFVVSELDQAHDEGPPAIVVARYVELLQTQLVTALHHNHSYLLSRPVRAAEPRYVRRAAEYIEAHAHLPLPVALVARAAGVSVRTLQAGFRKHRGSSPLGFLRGCRLELARRRLLATPHESIAEVALACGFHHFGRFSQLYAARFGETPSASRRRRFGRATTS